MTTSKKTICIAREEEEEEKKKKRQSNLAKINEDKDGRKQGGRKVKKVGKKTGARDCLRNHDRPSRSAGNRRQGLMTAGE
jgi:hypothetical protein